MTTVLCGLAATAIGLGACASSSTKAKPLGNGGATTTTQKLIPGRNPFPMHQHIGLGDVWEMIVNDTSQHGQTRTVDLDLINDSGKAQKLPADLGPLFKARAAIFTSEYPLHSATGAGATVGPFKSIGLHLVFEPFPAKSAFPALYFYGKNLGNSLDVAVGLKKFTSTDN
jgi:hypothetical protein